MIREAFRVLTVDLTSGRGRVVMLDGRENFAGPNELWFRRRGCRTDPGTNRINP